MAEQQSAGNISRLAELGEGVVNDALRLIEQEFQLMRQEVKDEIGKAKDAAVSLGAGAGLVAVSGILSVVTVIHLLHRVTGLPLWACYGLAAGACGASGAAMIAAGKERAARLQLVPTQTVASIKQDVSALAQQVSR